MIPRILPLLIILPLLPASCERREPATSGTSADKPSATPAESGFLLAKRGHNPPAGTKGETEGTMSINDASLLDERDGRQSQGRFFQDIKTRGTFEFLSDTKFRRTLVSRENTGKTVLGGREQPFSKKPAPLAGKPILLEKKDGKWTAALETGTPEPEEATEIEAKADYMNLDPDVALYGETPRKVGDKWEVDATKIGDFGIMTDVAGTYATEFTEIEDYQGIRCAVLKSEVDLVSKAEKRHVDMRIRGTVTTHRSLKDLIDLRSVISGDITIDSPKAPDSTSHIEGQVEVIQKLTITRP